MNLLVIGLIILLFIILFYQVGEHFTNQHVASNRPYIKLFQSFNGNNMIFEFVPVLTWPTAMYYKEQFRGVVKSVDLNLPKKHDGFDDIRVIELWSVYGGTNISSSESDFYSPYMQPHFALTANRGKYKLIVRVKAGSHIRMNLSFPVNKIMIYARF